MVLGVNLETEASHRKFCHQETLPFDLLMDPAGKICSLYGVRITNLLVAKFPARVTYVIGTDGRIRDVFQKVRPRGHAQEVLARISRQVS